MPTATRTRPTPPAPCVQPAKRRAPSARGSAPGNPRGPLQRLFGFLFRFSIRVLGSAVVVGGATLALYLFIASQYDLDVISRHLADADKGGSVEYVAPDGRETHRIAVPLEDMSPSFVNALIVREDLRFHDHHGVDFRGVVRSVLRNAKEGRMVQGASTITMQLARNSYADLAHDDSLHRKLTEAFLARRIERKFSKEDILEVYANMVFFGANLHGVERASLAFFGKSSGRLSLSESAMLAGIIRGPNAFSPFTNYDRALAERDVVLDRMVEEGYIDREENAQAKRDRPLILRKRRPVTKSL